MRHCFKGGKKEMERVQRTAWCGEERTVETEGQKRLDLCTRGIKG